MDANKRLDNDELYSWDDIGNENEELDESVAGLWDDEEIESDIALEEKLIASSDTSDTGDKKEYSSTKEIIDEPEVATQETYEESAEEIQADEDKQEINYSFDEPDEKELADEKDTNEVSTVVNASLFDDEDKAVEAEETANQIQEKSYENSNTLDSEVASKNRKKSKQSDNKKKVKDKKDKPKKQKESREIDEPEQPVEDFILYVLIDRKKQGLASYMENNGIRVSKIFDNISSAQGEMLMQTAPYRVVIIDTGSGKFTNHTNRKELVDLMGMRDESVRFSVFYSDSLLKSDILKTYTERDRFIDVMRYNSTLHTVVRLHEYTFEKYIHDSVVKEEVIENFDDVMRMRGLSYKPDNVIKEVKIRTMVEGDKLRGLMEENGEEGEFGKAPFLTGFAVSF